MNFFKLRFLIIFVCLVISNVIFYSLPPVFIGSVLLRSSTLNGVSVLSVSDQVAVFSDESEKIQVINRAGLHSDWGFWGYNVKWVNLGNTIIKISASGDNKENVKRLLIAAVDRTLEVDSRIKSYVSYDKTDHVKEAGKSTVSSDLLLIAPVEVRDRPTFPKIKHFVMLNLAILLLFALLWIIRCDLKASQRSN
jgi:hypothetical protein